MAVLSFQATFSATHSRTRRQAGLFLLNFFLWSLSTQAAFPLRFGWKNGLELRYRLTIEGRNTVSLAERTQSSNLHTRLHLTQRVLALGKGGIARLLTRVESGRSRRGKKDSVVMPPRQGTMRMDTRGRLLDGAQMSQGPAPLQLVFPERSLEIGDSWFNSLPPSREIPVPVRVRYTLTGFREEAGLHCVRIALRIESADASALGSPMDLDFHASGAILFAPKEGILVSSKISSDLTLTWRQPGPKAPSPVRARASFDVALEYRP
jgi:hypothetical protein